MALQNSAFWRGAFRSQASVISPMPSLSTGSAFFGREVTLAVHDQALHLPQGVGLRHFLFQSHPTQQVGHSLLHRQLRIMIGRLLRRLRPEETVQHSPLSSTSSSFIIHHS